MMRLVRAWRLVAKLSVKTGNRGKQLTWLCKAAETNLPTNTSKADQFTCYVGLV